MAFVIVPKTRGLNFANERVSTNLDGIGFELDFSWNQVAGSWFMDVFTESGELVAGSVRLVAGELLDPQMANSPLRPLGNFIVVDRGINRGLELCGPTSETLGSDPLSRHFLGYLEAT